MQNDVIGKRIKECRMERKISVQELAEYCGLSKATIHRYEDGTIKNIKMPVIESIAKKLNANTTWIIGDTDEKLPYHEGKNDYISAIDVFITLVRSDDSINDEKREAILKGLDLIKLIAKL